MPKLPSEFLNSLKGLDLPDPDGFIEVHHKSEPITSIRRNPFKFFVPEFEETDPVPWASGAYYLESRPVFTHDPSFHAGCYYVQEAGSMFLETALKQCLDFGQHLKILDLCAAPGGKSTVLNSLMTEESLLVSNEIVQNRSQTLAYNLSKWGRANTVVTNNTPAHFEALPGFFDVLVVDAPCSGSGLFRKQAEAIDEWSPEHVNACSIRQKHLLQSALVSLKEGGVLFYSTCSYSKEENEDIVDWLSNEQEMEVFEIKIPEAWGLVKNAKGIRFYPHLVRSEGFFCSVLIKRAQSSEKRNKSHVKNKLSDQEKVLLQKLVKLEGKELLKKNETYYLMNLSCLQFLSLPLPGFYFRKAGVCLGELKHQQLVPEHELALSLYLSESAHKVELSRDTALLYLKKEGFPAPKEREGLVCFTYQKNGIGWGKVLSNRINNYLPPALRVLK